MRVRWLTLAATLVGCDYLAWKLAIGANADTPALVAGLAMPALAIVLVWLAVLSAWDAASRAARGVSRLTAKPLPEEALSQAASDVASERIAA